MEQPELGAIILTGGSAVRLDGADKAGIEIGERTLLEHALAAVRDIPEVVVVGDEVSTSRPVTFRREDPPGGGPVAAVAAGLTGFVRAPVRVLLLAVDMPLVRASTVSRLALSARGDGAVLVDAEGRRQYLCGVYSVSRLNDAMPADTHGASMRSLLAGLSLNEVEAVGAEARDIDTWTDLKELRETLAPPH